MRLTLGKSLSPYELFGDNTPSSSWQAREREREGRLLSLSKSTIPCLRLRVEGSSSSCHGLARVWVFRLFILSM